MGFGLATGSPLMPNTPNLLDRPSHQHLTGTPLRIAHHSARIQSLRSLLLARTVATVVTSCMLLAVVAVVCVFGFGAYGFKMASNPHPEYSTWMGSVYYGSEYVSGADANSFEALERERSNGLLSAVWAKDSKLGYYKENPIRGSRGESFSPIGLHWAKDSQYVYCSAKIENVDRLGRGMEYLQNEGILIYKRLDPSKTTVFQPESQETGYVTDGQKMYYGAEEIYMATPDSFRRLIDDVWGDNRYVFFGAKTLETLTYGNLVHAKSRAFRRLEYAGFFTDGIGVYAMPWDFEPLVEADPINFKVLGNGYSKDLKHVWFNTNLIMDVDSFSFQVLDDGTRLLDRHGEIQLPDANLEPGHVLQRVSNGSLRDLGHWRDVLMKY